VITGHWQRAVVSQIEHQCNAIALGNRGKRELAILHKVGNCSRDKFRILEFDFDALSVVIVSFVGVLNGRLKVSFGGVIARKQDVNLAKHFVFFYRLISEDIDPLL